MRTILLLLLASLAPLFSATSTVDKVSGVSSAGVGAVGPTAYTALGSISGGAAFPHPPFIIVVDTTKAGSASTHFVLPCYGANAYNADVDWGDGGAHTTLTGSPGNVDHTYSVSGTYTIKIVENSVGGFPTIRFSNGGDKLKLMQISQWGTNKWLTLSASFYGCANLTITATDSATANTGTVRTLYFAFSGCSALTIFPWMDFHSVVEIDTTWSGCPIISFPALNLPLATKLDSGWYSCTAMTSFGLVTLGSVLTARYAFFQCSGLNGYNFPTLNLRTITDGTGCFQLTTLSTASYSNLIIDMALGATNTVTFHGGGSHYNAGAVAAHNTLTVTRSWTITDGGTP